MCVTGCAVVFRAILPQMWSPEVQGDWHDSWAASIWDNRAKYVHHHAHSPWKKYTLNQVWWSLSQSMQTLWLRQCQCILSHDLHTSFQVLAGANRALALKYHVWEQWKFSSSIQASWAECRTFASSSEPACGAISKHIASKRPIFERMDLFETFANQPLVISAEFLQQVPTFVELLEFYS